MIYYFLYLLQGQFSWLNVFRYQTFRAMLAFLITFFLVLLLQPVVIQRLKQLGLKGQPIRDDGPKEHNIKRGTPTMGGGLIVSVVAVVTVLLADLFNIYVWLTIGVLFSFSFLGFFDDWKKVSKQHSRGMSSRQKLIWQCGIAAFFATLLWLLGFSTELRIPFFKDWALELGVLFIPFVVLVVVATSNAVNLTDGLDGLAIGPVMTVAATYGVFTYLGGNFRLAEYLGIPYVSGVGEITVILAAITAAGLGFLWYNTFPAQVFMGDMGSLALGAVLGFISVLVKQELVLIVAGGIFVMEALSVIVQVYSFKMTGRRVFKMAPIHHHFELKGWAEPKIIVRFWIISIVLALVSLTTLKLR